MRILLLLLATAWFALGADAVHAGPLVAAIGAVSSFIGSLGLVGKLVVGVALSIGSSLLQKALAKKQDTSTQQSGVDLSVSMGDDVPMSFTVGTYATGGKRKYIGAWGAVGGTPNAYVTDVIEIGNIPCSGLNGFWAGDQKATILWAEPHADGRGYPVEEYRSGGVDYLWIKVYDGSQTVADPFLSATFGADAERPWLETMIGRGCPYAIITCRYNTELFSGLPDWAFEPGAPKFYDLRKDSTNGGSGAHRWGDQATWEATSNNVIIAYNIIRGVYYAGEWMFGGQSLSAHRLPASNWIAGANECDAAVEVIGGAEPAFRCGYEVRVDEEPLGVVEKLMAAANARIAEVGGFFKVLVGAPGGAVYSFSDDNIIVTEGQSLEPFPSLDATYNAIEATYPEPSEKWASKDAPGIYDAALELQDGNRRLPVGVALDAAPYPTQVQRIMRALIKDYRRFRTHSFYLPPEAYALEPNDVVSWSSERNGYDNKKFLVVSASHGRNLNILVALKEIDPADYDWDRTLQIPVSAGWVGSITPPPQPMTGWSVTPSAVADGAGDPRRPAILVECAAGLDDVARVWVQTRVKATGAVVFDSDTSVYAAPHQWLISGAWCLPSTQYQVRGKYVPFSSRETLWSDWLDVTTTGVLLGANDIYMPGVIAEVNAANAAYNQWVSESITDLDAQMSAVEAQSGANATAIGGLSADVADLDGQVTSYANAITQLSASTDAGDVTQANFRMQAVSGPDGYSRIGAQTRQGGAGTWRGAAWYLDTPNDPALPTRFIADAQQMMFGDMTSGSFVNPLVYDDGVWRMQGVRIGSALIDDLTVEWADIANVNITSADIGNLTVTSSNLAFSSVTQFATMSVPATWITSASWVTLATVVIDNQNPNPVLFSLVGEIYLQNTSGLYSRIVVELANTTNNKVIYTGDVWRNNSGLLAVDTFRLSTGDVQGQNTYVLRARLAESSGAGRSGRVTLEAQFLVWKR